MKVRIKPQDEAVKAALASSDDCYVENDGAWGDESIFGIDRRVGQWGKVVHGYKNGDYFHANNSFAYPLCVVDEEDEDDTPPTSDDLLRYGKIIADENMIVSDDDAHDHIRIRLIAYDGDLYYHKICDGDVVECRHVGTADA